MTDKELFGNSEQLDCSDCVNHGGDWECDHIHCRKSMDTISRQAAIDTAEWAYKACEGNLSYYHDLLVAALMDLTPAQQEWKKGKWIYHSEIGWGDTWLCDQCGEKTTSTVMGKPRANYCPMCGADMRGENDG